MSSQRGGVGGGGGQGHVIWCGLWIVLVFDVDFVARLPTSVLCVLCAHPGVCVGGLPG